MKFNISRSIRRTLTHISPMLNTKVLYYVKFKRPLDLKNPKTLNEKILYLKFHDYKDNETVKYCADKFRVRDYIKNKGMGDLLIPLIGAYENPNDINWEALPDSFVIKYNIGFGRNIIVRDKSKLDVEATLKKLKYWLKTQQWYEYSELQYKDVKPYILIEKFMGSQDGEVPADYKFYCMNGQSKYVMLCEDRGKGDRAKFFYYDRSWNMMPYTQDALDNPSHTAQKPDNLDEAFDIAQKLSEDFPFVRTDLYIIDGKVYFGELTFTPSAGMDNGRLPKTDLMLGEQLQL